MTDLSHLDENGRPQMVDVSGKGDTLRKARASGFIKLQDETLKLISDDSIAKGNVLLTAELAGIQAAKKTPDLIPLCHPLAISKVDVKATLVEGGVEVNAEVRCVGPTGVEMEALTAVSTALLTVYDMCKAVDKQMGIGNIVLLEKTKEEI
jgi:cyclic pyranopterin phosphate synthase